MPVTGRFNISGTVILFLQLKGRFNPNKLKTRNVLHLNGCHVAIYVKKFFPKSNDKGVKSVLLLSKMCYFRGSIIGRDNFVLACRLHRFHKNLLGFTVLFVKLSSSAAQSALLIVTEPGDWMGCPVTDKENMWLSSYRTPYFKSCSFSKNTHFQQYLIC